MKSMVNYLLAVTFFATLSLTADLSAGGSCPRCTKIEAERVAQGPQQVGYYDDVKIAENESREEIKNSSNHTPSK